MGTLASLASFTNSDKNHKSIPWLKDIKAVFWTKNVFHKQNPVYRKYSNKSYVHAIYYLKHLIFALSHTDVTDQAGKSYPDRTLQLHMSISDFLAGIAMILMVHAASVKNRWDAGDTVGSFIKLLKDRSNRQSSYEYVLFFEFLISYMKHMPDVETRHALIIIMLYGDLQYYLSAIMTDKDISLIVKQSHIKYFDDLMKGYGVNSEELSEYYAPIIRLRHATPTRRRKAAKSLLAMFTKSFSAVSQNEKNKFIEMAVHDA